jgi:hypothetical protein
VLLLCVGGATPAQSPPPQGELMLYGVRLRGASTEVFIAAALKAGATPLAPRADGPPSFDTRAAGAPALQRLTVLSDAAGLVSAQFVIKPYGQDNEALRELLVSKYGVPTTADGAADRMRDRKPIEFGSAEDFQLQQAMNHLKGQPVLLAKKDATAVSADSKDAGTKATTTK